MGNGSTFPYRHAAIKNDGVTQKGRSAYYWYVGSRMYEGFVGKSVKLFPRSDVKSFGSQSDRSHAAKKSL
jgi:hypothetical protein